MTETQFKEICDWQDKTFPDATALSKLKHLQMEIEKELIPELEDNFEPPIEEYADCIFLIFGSARKCGYNYWQIIQSIEDKFIINKEREWNKPDKDGVYLHKK